VAFGQGLYYVGSGVWPLVSMRSFEAVTGPKRDRWLVRTVGLLAMAFGGLLLRDAARDRPDPGTGLAGAAAFGTASLWYWARGRINHAYLLDGLTEAAMVGAWLGLSGRADLRPGGPAAAARARIQPVI
jgi:hypothetical protein